MLAPGDSEREMCARHRRKNILNTKHNVGELCIGMARGFFGSDLPE